MTYVGATPTTGDFKKLDAITASATATYNLTQGGVAVYPQSSSHCLVVLNGILQTGGSSFNIVNDTIVFAEALTSSDVINQILVLGNVNDIGVPSSDSVGSSHIQADAINATKIADDSISDEHLDITSITGQTAITSLADTDKFLVSDASDSGNLKYVEKQYLPSGALTFLSSTDLSSGVSEFRDIDFFTTYSSYKHFILDVQLICPSSNADLRLIFKDGSGDVAGNIQAAWKANRNNASDEDGGINGGSNSNGVQLFGNTNSSNGDAINGTIELWQPVGNADGDINMMWRLWGGQQGQNYWLYVAGGGTSESGNNATGFGIQRASGNLTTSGNYSYIKVYGVQST
jgi:hypothetical protein